MTLLFDSENMPVWLGVLANVRWNVCLILLLSDCLRNWVATVCQYDFGVWLWVYDCMTLRLLFAANVILYDYVILLLSDCMTKWLGIEDCITLGMFDCEDVTVWLWTVRMSDCLTLWFFYCVTLLLSVWWLSYCITLGVLYSVYLNVWLWVYTNLR